MLFCLVVSLLFSSFVYADMSACLKDLSSPSIINRPSPTIVVEFGNPIEIDTMKTIFSYFPEDERGRDFENPEDKTHLLELKDTSNESVMRYDVTEELDDGAYYTVYVSAEARDYREIDGEEEAIGSVMLEECRLFNVDLGPLEVNLVSPEGQFMSDENKELEFETNRKATCYISSTTDTIGRMSEMSTTEETYLHKNLHPGTDNFYVTCESETDQVSEEINLVLDTVPPAPPEIDDSSPHEEHPDIFIDQSRIRVKFEAEDDVSGIDIINFTIFDKESGSQAMGWASTDVVGNRFIVTRDDEGNPLRLDDVREYYFVAKARNNAGLWSDRAESEGFKVDITYDPRQPDDPCEKIGMRCEIGEECEGDENCLSGFCHPDDMVCAEPSCDDGFKSGQQTDVDCGGPNCDPCDMGMSCDHHSDCESGFCDREDLICAEPPDEPEPEPDMDPIVDDDTSDNNFMLSMLIVVMAVVLLGGGGFYGYKNWDDISSKLGISGGSAPSQQSASPSTPVSKPKPSPASSQSQGDTAPTSSQIKDMGAKVSQRLKAKERQRQRNNLFGGFSGTSNASQSDSKDKDDTITKKDIDNLFGGIK